MEVGSAECFAEEVTCVAGTKLWIVHQFGLNEWSAMLKPTALQHRGAADPVACHELVAENGLLSPFVYSNCGPVPS